MTLKGKKVLLAITGSIAAYKSILLIRLLVKQDAEVKVLMTPAAKDFVSPLVLSTLSKNAVIHELSNGDSWSNHVMLGRWADIMIVAPLTCNTLAKMASCVCDNLVLAVYLSATCPVLAVPAMDEDMWHHPSTQRNIRQLQEYGNTVMHVGRGDLASGLVGAGRMAETEEIMDWLQSFFVSNKPLTGKKALVTAGPTYEPIDPVRFIGNHSSGKMGIEIANELQKMGAEVTLVLGPSGLAANAEIHTARVQTAAEMYHACMAIFHEMDIAVMAAAVADYRVDSIAEQKIKKTDADISIKLVRNPDILKSCGAIKRENQLLAGFALETNDEEANAKQKLQQKMADMIILNSLKDEGAGFKTETNKISIFDINGHIERFGLLPKQEVARNIVQYIINRVGKF